eukprot:TRINITY_DN17910_c0_g1_i3.p1 TRINITY_DN17910_c0_g1~~TRINITY_DN17910_c0_g1_i3.p1  ORF type:complete len:145 (+),score=9.28 TRINITY_DN17910_c0_g1_i3:148-582(+)
MLGFARRWSFFTFPIDCEACTSSSSFLQELVNCASSALRLLKNAHCVFTVPSRSCLSQAGMDKDRQAQVTEDQDSCLSSPGQWRAHDQVWPIQFSLGKALVQCCRLLHSCLGQRRISQPVAFRIPSHRAVVLLRRRFSSSRTAS